MLLSGDVRTATSHPVPRPDERRIHPRSSSSRRWHNPLVDILPRLFGDIACLRTACQSAGAVDACSSTATNPDTTAATRRAPPDASFMVSAYIAQLRCEMPARRLQCQHRSARGRRPASRRMSAHSVSALTITEYTCTVQQPDASNDLSGLPCFMCCVEERLSEYSGNGRQPQYISSSRALHEQ